MLQSATDLGRQRVNGGSWSVYNNHPSITPGYRGSMPGGLYASYNSQYQTNGACQRLPLTRLDRPPVPSRGTLLLQHRCHVAGAMRADAARSCSSRLPGRLYAWLTLACLHTSCRCPAQE